MNTISIQDGGNDIFTALAHLGLPLGLAVMANKYETKKDSQKQNEQKGGLFLSDSLLLEAGLAVVPFGLIALSESKSETKSNTNAKDSKNKKNDK